jgi:CheY-like chemotaxis protein
MSYRVVGKMVRYVSAERGGQEEEVPVELVDFEATKRWEQKHTAPAEGEVQAPTIDPELLKEEADRAALTPEVAKDLRLPDMDNVLALDTFRDQPQLVPLPQSDGELNHNTAHNVVKAAVNPLSSSHQLVQLKGDRSAVQLHVNKPVIYIRIGEVAAAPSGSAPLTVDTHGASQAMTEKHPGDPASSRYVIVQADVRTASRIVASFKISALGNVKQQEDVIETTTEILPGGHWMKLTPKQSLGFGEYALMEILSDKEVNLGVWDFGVHPMAPANRDALLPQPKRPYALSPRRPNSE